MSNSAVSRFARVKTENKKGGHHFHDTCTHTSNQGMDIKTLPTCFGLLMTFFAYLVLYCVIIESFSTNIIVSGSAVAVECVFSGGHDTISLQCASIWPETIKVLMFVKKKLHLAHAQATAALRC
jgi:hypothetical protein